MCHVTLTASSHELLENTCSMVIVHNRLALTPVSPPSFCPALQAEAAEWQRLCPPGYLQVAPAAPVLAASAPAVQGARAAATAAATAIAAAMAFAARPETKAKVSRL
jgi:phosphotransferase system  glucose/maltose/N-acetylglucosamine-specific IIC component